MDTSHQAIKQLNEDSVMYRFSRAIYRDLQPHLLKDQLRPELGQRLLLAAC